MKNSAGAYGFRLAGVPGTTARLLDVPDEWPMLTLGYVPLGEPDPGQVCAGGTIAIRDDTAELWLAAGERIELERKSQSVRFVMREAPVVELIVHPLIGLPAAIHSVWLGRLAFHGGAFGGRSGAWALFGDRGAGKSTSLAQLADMGRSVVSDDVLIVEGRTLYAGPRAIDLRVEAADRFGGDAMGILGARERWRLRPQPVEAQFPLSGFVSLAWGDETSIESLSPPDRLGMLYANSAVYPGADQASALLDLLVLPAWRFTRPKDLDQQGSGLARLMEKLDQAPLTPA